MSTNVLITGSSGYLGSSLIHALQQVHLPAGCTIHASVRSAEHAEAVVAAGLEPWMSDIRDPTSIARDMAQKEISIVFWLVDVSSVDAQRCFLRALAEFRSKTGKNVHFVQTSGAKLFSSLAGAPTDKPLLDTAADLYETQKAQRAAFPPLQNAIETNNIVIDEGEALGVRTYIFVPCIVYGRHGGFGNPISIQTVAIVKAARAAGQVYKVDNGRPTWPVCHVMDNARLYLALLAKMLTAADNLPYGRQGYYLASSGSVAWEDLYAAIAAPLARRGVVSTANVPLADDVALEKMAEALTGGKEMVRLHLGGNCTLTAKRGSMIGWYPKYTPEHIIESADEEVERILNMLAL